MQRTDRPHPQLPFPVRQWVAGPHKNFHYVFADPDSGKAATVDPTFDLDQIWRLCDDEGWSLDTAFITHGHWDHIGGIHDMVEHGVSRVVAHRSAAALEPIQALGPKFRGLDDGETILVGGLSVQLLHTPGHQPEAASYLVEDALFSGDTLFVGSCGRTDFPGGDTDAMYRSMARIRSLPPTTHVFGGHDYHERAWATLATECIENPALATRDRNAFGGLYCLTH